MSQTSYHLLNIVTGRVPSRHKTGCAGISNLRGTKWWSNLQHVGYLWDCFIPQLRDSHIQQFAQFLSQSIWKSWNAVASGL